MVLLYMLCTMPIFVWALPWAGGMLGDMDEGQFRTILYVLVGFALVMVFIVMPIFVVPRILSGPDREEGSADSSGKQDPGD